MPGKKVNRVHRRARGAKPRQRRVAKQAAKRRAVRQPSRGGMANIQHVVVVMLENRSFDNIVGWLYSGQGNRPPINPPPSTPPTYAGLTGNEWNPDNSNTPVPVHRGTTSPTVPTPGPQELFDHMHVERKGQVGRQKIFAGLLTRLDNQEETEASCVPARTIAPSSISAERQPRRVGSAGTDARSAADLSSPLAKTTRGSAGCPA